MYRFLRSIPTWVLWLLVIIWSVPTVGLLVNSVRSRDQQRTTGWWTVITGNIDGLTLGNYREVLGTTAAGGMKQGLTNSIAIALPATIIPIAFAAFAAYAFAWIEFKHRQGLFIGTVALLAVPLQVALIPLLLMYVNGAHWTIPWFDKTITIFPDLNLAGTTTAVWLTHTAFAMPFAIFLLHNYISTLPKDIFESARIDGAVPVDVERLPDRGHDGRRQRERGALDGGDRGPDRPVRPVRAPPHGRGVPPSRRSTRRVLPVAAVLRPRHPRRLGEGLTATTRWPVGSWRRRSGCSRWRR
jgi:ABC-type glycerol-3-phosphate transport system permease component